MSGHSKWHSIKHKKGAADKARGKLFAKLIKQIEVAARSGWSDLEGNPTLRAAVQKARDSSVPADTIDRAIKRGTGELEGVRYEPASYEGYASGGVAVYIECLTDNRNRTGQEVKNIFTRNGGSLAEPGAVAWQFERKGVIYVERRAATEDDLVDDVLDAGAEDIVDEATRWRSTTTSKPSTRTSTSPTTCSKRWWRRRWTSRLLATSSGTTTVPCSRRGARKGTHNSHPSSAVWTPAEGLQSAPARRRSR